MYEDLLTYDLGPGVEAFTSRRDSILPCPVLTAHQVHGCRIAIVTNPLQGTENQHDPCSAPAPGKSSQATDLFPSEVTRDDLQGYDALITDLRDFAIGVRTADCVPVLLYDPVHQVVAAVHAGWRGTVQCISVKVIAQMSASFGTRPQDLCAVIGPAIGPDSFQVGEEVVAAFSEARDGAPEGFPMERIWSIRKSLPGKPMSGGHHIDLFEANRWLLEQAGIPGTSVQISGIDTYTAPDFFSARREGLGTGRNINAIKLI